MSTNKPSKPQVVENMVAEGAAKLLKANVEFHGAKTGEVDLAEELLSVAGKLTALAKKLRSLKGTL